MTYLMLGLRSIFLLILIALAPLIAFSQQPSLRNYTVDDGLPSSEVYHVIQDSKGYVWFATNMGVSRFDGRSFRNFDVQNGLPENTVFEIYEDSKQRLWFVCFPFQLAYYENDSIYMYKYNETLHKLAGHGLVPLKKSFLADEDDGIWFSFLNQGILYSINNQGNLKESIDLDEKNPWLSISEVKGEILTVQNSKRRMDSLIVRVKTSYLDTTLNVRRDNKFYSGGYLILDKNSNGDIIFAQNNSVILIEKDGTSRYCELNSRVLWLHFENDNIVWIGTEFRGAHKYTINNLFSSGIKEAFLDKTTITSITKDNEGGMWFTTQGAGVYYLASKAFQSYSIEDGLAGQYIKYIEPFQGKLFIGAEDTYVMNYLQNDKIYTISDFGQGISKIKALASYSNDYLFVGTENYLYKYDGKSFKRIVNNHPAIQKLAENRNPAFSFKKIFPFSSSVLLIGQMRSLGIITNDNVTYDSFYDDSTALRIEAIERISENDFLLGTFNGLYEFNNFKFRYLGDRSKLLTKRITDILKYGDSKYILATKGSGLVILADDKIYVINQSKGLSSNSITSLLIKEDKAWIATNYGLNVISLSDLTKANPRIFVFKKEHGLISNEINQIKEKDGIFYIATSKGLTVFNSKLYHTLANPSPVYLRSFSVNKKDTSLTSNLQLIHSQNFITISYEGVNFRDAGNLLYRYRLSGLKDSWIFTRNLQVEYAFLPPGKYTFEVYAINSQGLVSTSPATIKFTIKPPFWRSWWFIGLMIGLSIIALTIYFKFRIRILRTEHKLQSDISKYREQALIRQMDPHFVFNSLNSIQSFIFKNDSRSSSHYLSKFAKLMRLILNNSQKQAVALSEEIDALSLYLELEAMRFREKFDYSINVDPDIETEITKVPAFLVQPFVENAIWHGIMNSSNPGVITVDYQKQGEKIICNVTDNGIGRTKAAEIKLQGGNTRKSMGISIVETRLNLLSNYYGHNLGIVFTDLLNPDNSPAGTRVTITIPIVKSVTYSE